MVLADGWNGFGEGTPIEECWAWIEEVFGISVGDIMYKGE